MNSNVLLNAVVSCFSQLATGFSNWKISDQYQFRASFVTTWSILKLIFFLIENEWKIGIQLKWRFSQYSATSLQCVASRLPKNYRTAIHSIWEIRLCLFCFIFMWVWMPYRWMKPVLSTSGSTFYSEAFRSVHVVLSTW